MNSAGVLEIFPELLLLSIFGRNLDLFFNDGKIADDVLDALF